VVSIAEGLVPFDPDRVVAVRRADSVFKRPVHIGDTIHVEVTELDREWLDGPFWNLRCLWKVKNQRGRIVTKITVDLLWREGGDHDDAGSPESLLGEPSEVRR
jgi:acyl dehydratase